MIHYRTHRERREDRPTAPTLHTHSLPRAVHRRSRPSPTSRDLRSYASAFSPPQLLRTTFVATTHRCCSSSFCLAIVFGHTNVLVPPQPRPPAPHQACLELPDCSPASGRPESRGATCERPQSHVAEASSSTYINSCSTPLTFLLMTFTDIESLVQSGDTAAVERVKNLIYRPESPAPVRSAASPASFPAANGYGSPSAVSMAQGLYPAPVAAAAAAVPYSPQNSSCAPIRHLLFYFWALRNSTNLAHSDFNRIHFKESPFYTVLKALSNVEQCPGTDWRCWKMLCLNINMQTSNEYSSQFS